MSASRKKENLLSSWKEIAKYLDCNERTCRRWEKDFGLPVHRFKGKPKYRIYAYKDEVDRWLKKLFKNNMIPQEAKKRPINWRLSLYLLIPIIAVAVIYTFILKESDLFKKPAPSGVPQSTGPLTLRDNDIVSTEFDLEGRLRVWRKTKNNFYKEIWRIEPVRHSSLSVGNVDNKRDCEIVAPGVCRLVEERGDRRIYSFKFFLNIYKQGVKDWWKTTFYSDKDCVFEKKNWHISEIAVGDIDAEPGNEIILITMSCLAIFKYDDQQGEFRLIRSRKLDIEGTPLFLKSIAVGNIDSDDAKEIIIAADECTESDGTALNKGWILIFDVQDDWPTLVKTIQVDANLSFHSLKLGNIINGGHPEIVSCGYRSYRERWDTYIMGWDVDSKKIFDEKVSEIEDPSYQNISLDVGNLSPHFGEEIVVANSNMYELIYYYWNGQKLVEDSRFPFMHEYLSLKNVCIVDSDSKSDPLPEIIIYGSGWEKVNTGRFYLQVLGFNKGFFSKWFRLGGEREEKPVSYAAVGKRFE